jgi:hypothetical protein
MDEPQCCFFGVKVANLSADCNRLVTAVAAVVGDPTNRALVTVDGEYALIVPVR